MLWRTVNSKFAGRARQVLQGFWIPTQDVKLNQISDKAQDYNVMKTPERWRALPWRALFVSIFAQKSSKDVNMSCCDVTWRHAVT